ncbi:MAG: triose-phosphate isomerase, partial [Pseudomonadota bacterium]|nr:triose-phosphate isomerase [Pseudomonadota bacterium]
TGGQDCHGAQEGAHTGDVSADMLIDAGAKWVIVGHSERRAEVKRGGHGETSKLVRKKVLAAQMAGLRSIVCVGETLAERKSCDTLKVVGAQLRQSLPDTCSAADIVIAYEPVWAIGSGLTPNVEQIGAVHAHIRKALTRRFGDAGAAMRVLYGGSVNAENAGSIFAVPMVGGALVGGASLDADAFAGIIDAYRC